MILHRMKTECGLFYILNKLTLTDKSITTHRFIGSLFPTPYQIHFASVEYKSKGGTDYVHFEKCSKKSWAQ